MVTATKTRPLVDAEEDELAAVDAAFIRAFGRDMGAWDYEVRDLYETALQAVFGRYPQAVTG